MDRHIAFLVPSRGRPETVAELHQAFADTSRCTTASSLTFVVDDDDPEFSRYAAEVDRLTDGWLALMAVEGGTMVKALNEAAARLLTYPAPQFALGFCGDDHRPRTQGWDLRYLDELVRLAESRRDEPTGVGMVYGDDGFQGPNLPTQIAMTTETVRRLGWMAPPTFRHLFVDNVWKALGEAVGRISYLPDVLVEHLHPGTGKVPWTPGHERVNAGDVWEHDRRAFDSWKADRGPDGMNAAIDRLLGRAEAAL